MLKPRPDRGSVLMLMPAAVLIVLLLGSIAVDFAIAFLGERELASLASAAANDAATAAFDAERFREDGTFVLDLDRAEEIVASTVAASGTEVDLEATEVEPVTVSGRPGFRVTLRGRVEYVFARAVPGLPRSAEVEASAVAIAEEG